MMRKINNPLKPVFKQDKTVLTFESELCSMYFGLSKKEYVKIRSFTLPFIYLKGSFLIFQEI
ncbi:hypothetical protein CEY02_17150 [Bacillus pumilus]|uniref:Uncharacterized protein n=1 Tax=Bacillus pumilus TaxID=1408 RepID=A0A2A5IRJ0_BACPU|nr:hypothetical protein CEY02_17150 [Bacillus pumilus]